MKREKVMKREIVMEKAKALVVACIFVVITILGAGCSGAGTPAQEPPEQQVEPESAGAQQAEPEAAGAPETDPGPESGLAVTGEILIAAAASLQNALEGELIPMFNEEYPDVKVVATFDSSGKLQTQIEEGLDAQLFFSAATKQMDALVDGGFIDSATVTGLLENEVVLITGVDTETAVTGFENITDAASIAVGDPASVPAGQYAQEVLESLGLWDGVSGGASLGTNVTEVLNWVAEGSAEVGVVYMTDAASMPDKVRVIATAPEGTLKTPVIYPVGLQPGLGDKAEAAEAFLAFLKGAEALEVFKSYGFKPL
jgi:molybdate transport system substrate-binding protein